MCGCGVYGEITHPLKIISFMPKCLRVKSKEQDEQKDQLDVKPKANRVEQEKRVPLPTRTSHVGLSAAVPCRPVHCYAFRRPISAACQPREETGHCRDEKGEEHRKKKEQ